MVPQIVVADAATPGTYQEVIDAISTTLSNTNLTSILAYGVSVSIGLVLLWFAIKKCAGMLNRAFRRGKLRL